MGTAALAPVIDLDPPTKPLQHNGLVLVKPCSKCDRPAAHKLTLTTGIDDVWPPSVMRACVDHLVIALKELAELAVPLNNAGDHPALFPWAVAIVAYQR